MYLERRHGGETIPDLSTYFNSKASVNRGNVAVVSIGEKFYPGCWIQSKKLPPNGNPCTACIHNSWSYKIIRSLETSVIISVEGVYGHFLAEKLGGETSLVTDDPIMKIVRLQYGW